MVKMRRFIPISYLYGKYEATTISWLSYLKGWKLEETACLALSKVYKKPIKLTNLHFIFNLFNPYKKQSVKTNIFQVYCGYVPDYFVAGSSNFLDLFLMGHFLYRFHK